MNMTEQVKLVVFHASLIALSTVLQELFNEE